MKSIVRYLSPHSSEDPSSAGSTTADTTSVVSGNGYLDRLIRAAQLNPAWTQAPLLNHAGATAATCLLLVGQARSEVGWEAAAVVLVVVVVLMVVYNWDGIQDLVEEYQEEEVKREELRAKRLAEMESEEESVSSEQEVRRPAGLWGFGRAGRKKDRRETPSGSEDSREYETSYYRRS